MPTIQVAQNLIPKPATVSRTNRLHLRAGGIGIVAPACRAAAATPKPILKNIRPQIMSYNLVALFSPNFLSITLLIRVPRIRLMPR